MGPKPGRRRDAAKHARELVGTVNSGVARLTPKDLLKIKGLTKKVVALNRYWYWFNRRRIPKNRRLKDAHRIIIDSGATISLLRKHRWLRQLATP